MVGLGEKEKEEEKEREYMCARVLFSSELSLYMAYICLSAWRSLQGHRRHFNIPVLCIKPKIISVRKKEPVVQSGLQLPLSIAQD